MISLEDDPDLANLLEDPAISSSLDWDTGYVLFVFLCNIMNFLTIQLSELSGCLFLSVAVLMFVFFNKVVTLYLLIRLIAMFLTLLWCSVKKNLNKNRHGSVLRHVVLKNASAQLVSASVSIIYVS